MSSVSSVSPQSLVGAQAFVCSKGVCKTEWDEMLTTTKNTAKANTKKSVLSWVCHHKHSEQEKPGNPSVPSRTAEPQHQGTGAQPGTHGWERVSGEGRERKLRADSSY